MKWLTKIIITAIFMNLLIFGQQTDYSKEAGYIDFGNLEELESGNRVVDVFLEGNLLKLVGKFAKSEDPQMAELIGGLKMIKVKMLEITSENEKKIISRIENVVEQLNKKGWDRLVRIKDRDERVNVYLKSSSSDQIVGLVVTSIKDEEATFVNILGDIDLETIGKLSKKFDIPALEKIDATKR